MSEANIARRELLVTSEPNQRTTPQGERERVDHFLGRQFDDLSRSRIEALIKEGAVTVDGRVPKPSQAATAGQRIVLDVPPLEEPSAEPEEIPLDIRFEDSDLIVVNKAAGMVVHPAPGHPSGTLVNALLYHCGDLSGIGGVLRPGIVHRLDKDTSGLLVVAKSQQAHMRLSDALKERWIQRLYLAVVWGRPTADEGTVDTWIGRSRSDRKRMASYTDRKPSRERRWGRPGEEEEMLAWRDEDVDSDGDPEEIMPGEEQSDSLPPGVPSDARRAVTHYRTSTVYDIAALLECRLETGRTHQVRVHMAHIGHSVVGDAVYGGRDNVLRGIAPERRSRAQQILACMPRQALHARKLAFEHPLSGESMEFEADPPEDFMGLLDRLEEEQ
jgi:23S rRNA pseudouridine1911/1915/1917 synthase